MDSVASSGSGTGSAGWGKGGVGALAALDTAARAAFITTDCIEGPIIRPLPMDRCPNDDEIRNAYTRVVGTKKALWVECREMLRKRAGKFVSDWIPVKSLPRGTPEPLQEAERQEALGNPKFFGICKQCGKRYPMHLIHDQNVCSDCEERELKGSH